MTTIDSESPRALFERLITTILDGASACHLDGSLVNEVGPYVDGDSTDAKSAEELLAASFDPKKKTLLDYGCGAAHHKPFIESIGYQWHGVDYIESVSRLVVDAVANQSDVTLYDGRVLPFQSETFDTVYSMLVFQHLRHVDEAFAEIGRVLKPGGLVIGQVSSLEQMQDYGTFCFTVFGMKVAAETAGLEVRRLYPKHDVFSFLIRRLMITLGASDDNEFTSALNPDGFFQTKLIETALRLGLSARDINLLRLKFCSQFVFSLQKVQ